ncbi:TPA: hypothetical protein ACGIKE_000257 [Acinetobacter baumannii]|uniref:hypothetical protein n=1 Tax=Acinetobacter baumannii TaxID=470 RepID=UPI00338F8F19
MKEVTKSPPSNITQTLVIDSSKIKKPIELKIDQVTDYGALTFTLIITTIVSAITAYVTIFLVTKSNNQLIENQKEQNERQLLKQEEFITKQIKSQERQKYNELNTQSKQLWLNDIRELATKFLFNINTITLQILNTVNSSNAALRDNSEHEKARSDFATTRQIINEIELNKINLELFLNADSPTDTEIIELMRTLEALVKDLNARAHNELTKKIGTRNITYEEFSTLPELQKIYKAEALLKICFANLIKEKRIFVDN